MDATRLLAAWGLEGATCSPITVGLINQTFAVESPAGRFILQRLNPIFDPMLHHDIEAITRRLESTGLVTPRLVAASDGHLWVEDDLGGVWRLQTRVEGHTVVRVSAPEQCHEAGRLLGRFHAALWDCDHEFRASRLGVHDTRRHLTGLEQALTARSDHRSFDTVRPLAEAIGELASGLDLDTALPDRVVHGDPKISNVLFDQAGRAVCLIDLDTLARMPIPVELGDAFRSWCATSGEDEEGRFSMSHFAAGLAGYAQGIDGRLSAAEWSAVPVSVLRISTELAARFCADALNESYFGWDPVRFDSASDHNLARTRSMVSLSRSIEGLAGDMADEVHRVFHE